VLLETCPAFLREAIAHLHDLVLETAKARCVLTKFNPDRGLMVATFDNRPSADRREEALRQVIDVAEQMRFDGRPPAELQIELAALEAALPGVDPRPSGERSEVEKANYRIQHGLDRPSYQEF
jgi:hypothetical protein